MSVSNIVEFSIVKEPWNKYEIQDGSILKIRTILEAVRQLTEGNKIKYHINTRHLTTVYPNSSLKGIPNPNPTPNQEIQNATEKSNLSYSVLGQNSNEYVLENKTKIKIDTSISTISRSKLYNKFGEPIYTIRVSHTVNIEF